jgi:phosphate transport system permease protein
MDNRPVRGRRMADRLVKALSGAAAGLCVFFLAWILFVVVRRGAAAINWTFFTHLPTPPGIPDGGMANCLVGTVAMTALATLIGVPVGALSGVFLAEFGRASRLSPAVRFATNVLLGMPSIIIGVFVYALVVARVGHFSGYAGALALAIVIMPIVAQTTEDIVGLVPNTLRESALALGVPYWRMVLQIVFRAARTGLLTGVMLAVARVGGETAPLLFTALNNPNWGPLSGPTGNLTVTIFNFAMSPHREWQVMAWGASLLITAGILLMTIVGRAVFRAGGVGAR